MTASNRERSYITQSLQFQKMSRPHNTNVSQQSTKQPCNIGASPRTEPNIPRAINLAQPAANVLPTRSASATPTYVHKSLLAAVKLNELACARARHARRYPRMYRIYRHRNASIRRSSKECVIAAGAACAGELWFSRGAARILGTGCSSCLRCRPSRLGSKNK